ncbi:MAG: Qat anti-phage system QueC-like protein QatC, partial [Candidatus Eremiobacterota bacterium]
LLTEQEFNKIALVSIYKNGRDTSVPQNKLLNLLEKKYSKNRIEQFSFFAQTYKNNILKEAEKTERSRSFLFLCHGIALAHSLGPGIPLYVPENGFISLNVPLTDTRICSLSTRTNHPYFLSLFKELLSKLDIHNEIFNPYEFSTKGEMIINSKDLNFLNRNANKSMSCAHPTKGGWGTKLKHCGYCIPCIIRRAAMYKADLDNKKNYRHDILSDTISPKLKSGQDIRALLMMINRQKNRTLPSIFEVLTSGPLPGIAENKKKYVEVYEKSIKEIKFFLEQYE